MLSLVQINHSKIYSDSLQLKNVQDLFWFSLNLSTVYSDSFPQTSSLVQINLSIICSDSSPDPCRFSLNLSTVYSDSFLQTLSLVQINHSKIYSDSFQLKNIQNLFWFSLNPSTVYPDTFQRNTSSSDKSLQRFILILSS